MFGNKYSSKNIAQAMGEIQEGLAKERETITKKLADIKAKRDNAIKAHELALQEYEAGIEKCHEELSLNDAVTQKVEKVLI